MLKLIAKIVITILPALIGIIAGTIIVFPVIGWINHIAGDGPIFPAPLISIAIAAVFGILIFVLQSIILVYDLFSHKEMGFIAIVIGIGWGALSGIGFYYMVIDRFQREFQIDSFCALVGLGILQSGVVFGLHWLFYKIFQSMFPEKIH